MAIIALDSFGPRIATRTRARSRLGIARMTSISRITTVSNAPRKKPEVNPMVMPKLSDRVTTITPTASE